MQITQITPSTLVELRPKIQEAISGILKEYGLILSPNLNFTYDSNECNCKLKISIPSNGNSNISRVAETTLKSLGIFDVKFNDKAINYKVIDYNARKYKFPVVLLNENTNTRIYCTVNYVKQKANI